MRPELPERLRADPLRLKQILFNLMSNAVKFTEAGGVTLRASAGEAGARLVIEVIDTGCGIDAATRARLFSSFEQAAGSARRHGGTGLGLAISRRLAELMGGTLEVESEPGRGSTFRLDIPLVPALSGAAQAPREGEATCPGAGRALSVLLAEDHAVNRRIVALFLEPLGWRLTMAEDGREAVRLAGQEAFDAILMDMRMPELDGPDAVRAIRDGGGPNAATPVIALSANALEQHRSQWRAVGVEAFLSKPVDPRTLIAAVTAAAARERGAAAAAA